MQAVKKSLKSHEVGFKCHCFPGHYSAGWEESKENFQEKAEDGIPTRQ
jgi:hypothetical protein